MYDLEAPCFDDFEIMLLFVSMHVYRLLEDRENLLSDHNWVLCVEVNAAFSPKYLKNGVPLRCLLFFTPLKTQLFYCIQGSNVSGNSKESAVLLILRR